MTTLKNRMTLANFLAAIKANNAELMTQCDSSEFSYRDFDYLDDCETMLKRMSDNLRTDGFYDGIGGEEFVRLANELYSRKDIRRFDDYHIADIAVNAQEPSAIITDDGERLDLLGGKFYTYTEDGFTFAEPASVTFSGGSYRYMCYNYFRVNGKTYCTTAAYANDEPVGIVLWEEAEGTTWGETSTAKVFNNPQVIFPYAGGELNNFGNTFVINKDNTWYLFIEIAGNSEYANAYEIYLASSSTLDGTYTLVDNDPVIFNPEFGLTIAGNSAGNPDIVMLKSGIPYMSDGKYYLMYHHMMHNWSKSFSYLYRAYSYDLQHWTVEAPIMSGRLPPDMDKWTNADACWCEFKGRSYLFYMRNANQYLDTSETGTPSINACIDFRPMSELLKIKP